MSLNAISIMAKPWPNDNKASFESALKILRYDLQLI